MNAEVMQGRWSEMRREAQRRWNKLSDEELDSARGQVHNLTNLLEERYGLDPKKAEKEVNRLVKQYGEQANNMLDSTRDFIKSNPWLGIVGAVVVLGVVFNFFVRPARRGY